MQWSCQESFIGTAQNPKSQLQSVQPMHLSVHRTLHLEREEPPPKIHF